MGCFLCITMKTSEYYKKQGDNNRDSGNLDLAIENYTNALDINQDYWQAHANLSMLLANNGDIQPALKHALKAVHIAPDIAELHDNLGNMYRLAGDLRESESSYNLAISLNQELVSALYNRSLTYQKLGETDKAIQSLQTAISIQPNQLDSHILLGDLYAFKNIHEKAAESYRKAISLDQDLFTVYIKLGRVLDELMDHGAAINTFKIAARKNPESSDAYLNLGVAYQHAHRLDDALHAYEKSILCDPLYEDPYLYKSDILRDKGDFSNSIKAAKYAVYINAKSYRAHNAIGNTLKDLGNLQESVEHYNKAIQIQPDYAEAYNNRGGALAVMGHTKTAIASYNKAIQIQPDYAEPHNNIGVLLRERGNLSGAIKSYNAAIHLRPDYAEAHRNLSTIKKYSLGDPQISLMENLFADPETSESSIIHLCFALAKTYDDLGNYSKSFKYLEKGNHLRSKELNYNIHDDQIVFTTIKHIFSAGAIPVEISPDSSRSIQPIFILGMPRSGTSLVEQILASHTKVYGAGELESIGNLVNPILSKLHTDSNNTSTRKLLKSNMIEIHNSYLNTLSALNVSENIITDKMPLNFRWIGFILSAFPTAKIIHLNRDAIATCWSIYRHYFSHKGNGYAYNMDDLTKFYSLYTDLMSFWHKQFPNSIYDLNYDKLTENQQEETHNLLEFCGLEWDEQCMDFYKTKRSVKTASAAQVRKTMYKGSSKAWRKYEKHLQYLVEELTNI